MIPLLAGAGLLVGGTLPWLIARIPDREPLDGEPARMPYRELAALPGLTVLLGAAASVTWAVVGIAHTSLGVALPAFLIVFTLGVAMAYVDFREHRLPDWLTYPAFAGAAVALGMAAVLTGEWAAYGRAWAAAASSLAFYLLLALLRPADLGIGDVKLGAVIGLVLGWLGWPVLVSGVFAAFVVGGLLGVGLMAAGRAGRRTAIPFGPPMLLGALVATVWGEALANAYLAL